MAKDPTLSATSQQTTYLTLLWEPRYGLCSIPYWLVSALSPLPHLCFALG
jgi:hypothetical protein